MIFGAGVFSYTVGNLSSILANFDSHDSQVALKLERLNVFCKQTKLSTGLRDELKRDILYTSRKGLLMMSEKQKVFDELPAQLKSEASTLSEHVDLQGNVQRGYIADRLLPR